MDVQTLFFASYRDLVGSASLMVSVPLDATVGDLVDALRARGAPFDRLPPDPAVAVNREITPAGRRLALGDEVALIPPVAGG